MSLLCFLCKSRIPQVDLAMGTLTKVARFFLCPETGGKTLEQVDYLFGHGARAWKNVNFEDTEGSWDEKPTMIHEDEVK
jgi:hypothetical protein